MLFNLRNNVTYLSLYLTFIDVRIINSVMARINAAPHLLVLKYNKKTYKTMSIALTTRKVYQLMAVYIRITGLQNKSTEATAKKGKKAPVRESIDEARTHFKTITDDVPNADILLRLNSIFLLSREEHVLLSENFTSIVRVLGQGAAGDEKLFYFSGIDPDVKKIASKPGGVGLWFFQFTASLRNGLSFLLQFDLSTMRVEDRSVVATVKKWKDIIISKGARADRIDPQGPEEILTILAYDSHYQSADSRALMNTHPLVPYTCSVNQERMKPEIKFLTNDYPDRHKINTFRVMVNDSTGEMLVQHYSPIKGLDEKFNFSKGFYPAKLTPANKAVIPSYDIYAGVYNKCDIFNRKLHDKTYPHARGGKYTSGYDGCIHDFAMACTLHNTFSAYSEINNTDPSSASFQEKCIVLSDALYRHALTIND